jgi:hypothetical protein
VEINVHKNNICHICTKYHCHVSLVTKWVTGDFLQLTFNDVGRGGREGREGGWVKKCFLSLRQTALLSAEGKKGFYLKATFMSIRTNDRPLALYIDIIGSQIYYSVVRADGSHVLAHMQRPKLICCF